MDIFFNMSSVHAAALYAGLLVLLMLGLKFYVGARRGALQIPSGETTPEFSRVTRVQLNAVEDVPVLLGGILGLGMLGMPAGLASSSGFSLGRLIGTLGTMVVYFAVAGALLVHAFTP